MRKLSFFLATFLILAACNNSGKDTTSAVTWHDLESENLKGDIASYEETSYKVDSMGNIGEADSCCADVTEYDENGNSIKNVSKDKNGTISGETVMTRHPNGQFKSMSSTKDGKSNGGFRVDIDADGKITLAVAIDSTGKDDVYYTDVTMNDVGEVTGWKQYDKDSVFRMQGESVYDKHQMLSNTIKDSVGTVKNSSTSKYNDKGELIESSFTNVGKDSTTTKVTKYTYDAHDEMGNWTQRTTMEDGKPTKIVKRTYTYRKEEEKK
ncbi:MAG: hypothetical protein KDB99_13430 [Chitinophagaceae bacterium]|nr:hypothetical protein [Chitinophagaceae bacterium]MCB9054597.1 hypothetical protein [Chitinophagales bacterium]